MMARIDDDHINACRRELIECAVIEHFRWHIDTDCIALEMISQNGNKHSKETVALIAKDYQIARTLTMSRKTKIAQILNRVRDRWPHEIVARAKLCGELTEEISGMKLSTRNCRPASAVTKLVWFLKPDGWTLFDSLASQAIISQQAGENSVDRMLRFYAELNARGFLRDAYNIQKLIDHSKIQELNGARVIDKFLMLIGMDDVRREFTMEHNRLIGEFIKSPDISKFAKTIANCCAPNLLKHPEHREAI